MKGSQFTEEQIIGILREQEAGERTADTEPGAQVVSFADAAGKLEAWRRDYNEQRPHSAIRNNVPAALMKSVRATSCDAGQSLKTLPRAGGASGGRS